MFPKWWSLNSFLSSSSKLIKLSMSVCWTFHFYFNRIWILQLTLTIVFSWFFFLGSSSLRNYAWLKIHPNYGSFRNQRSHMKLNNIIPYQWKIFITIKNISLTLRNTVKINYDHINGKKLLSPLIFFLPSYHTFLFVSCLWLQ